MSADYPPLSSSPGISGMAIPLPDRITDPMQQRLAAAVVRLHASEDQPLAARFIYTLRDMQATVFEGVTEFTMSCVSPITQATPYGRIILPPRTGKTVIAGHAVAQTGLTTTFITNTKTLVEQAERDFREMLPDTLVGVFYGERQQVVPSGINVTTYEMMRSRWHAGTLPAAIRNSALVFADEAHHAMTEYRVDYIREAFDPRALRIALTATPDYSAKRALVQFFPELIHELTLIEAVELGLLAPLRVWVAEVDADASTVDLIAGEYDEGTLSRLMSEAPFFASAAAFRYDAQNLKTPTLITCQTRQQAYDCQRFLEAHRPEGTPKPALVLGETEERDRILRKFEEGTIDTIVSVRVLVEGWDSPRCKTLIDLAPCLSLVTATQKFCRVLTRQDDQEARIYMILPTGLKRSPIMPMELLAPSFEPYETGTLVGRAHVSKAHPRLRRHPRIHPVERVSLKSHIVLTHRVEKPLLDPANPAHVRSVLTSHAWFDADKPCTFRRFRTIVFRHHLFTGRADHFMRQIRMRPTSENYQRMLERYYPEGVANMLLADDDLRQGKTCSDDRRYLRRMTLASSPETEEERDKFEQAYYALGAQDPADQHTPEEIMMWRERWESVDHCLNHRISQRKQRVIELFFGIRWREASVQEIAESYEVTGGRIHNMINQGLYQMRFVLNRPLSRAATRLYGKQTKGGFKTPVPAAAWVYERAMRFRPVSWNGSWSLEDYSSQGFFLEDIRAILDNSLSCHT